MNQRMLKKMVVVASFAILVTLAVSMPTFAGPTNGYESGIDTVCAGCFTFYDRYFWGGIGARVTVSGDGDTLLGIEIYDENGFLIVTNSGWGSFSVYFMPYRTGAFRVVVRNFGSVWNRYFISLS